MHQYTIKNIQEIFDKNNRYDVNISFLKINEYIGKISNILIKYNDNPSGRINKIKLRNYLSSIINNLVNISISLGIDLEDSIRLKEEYNSVRYEREDFLNGYSNDLTIEDFQKAIFIYENNRPGYIIYMYKLIEEIGELSKVIKDDLRMSNTNSIKGTIEEELHDVFYYVLCLLSEFDLCYDYSLLDMNLDKNPKIKIKMQKQLNG